MSFVFTKPASKEAIETTPQTPITTSTTTSSPITLTQVQHYPNHLYVLQALFYQPSVITVDDWYSKLQQLCINVFPNTEYKRKVNPEFVTKCTLDEITLILSLVNLCNGINLYNTSCNGVDFIPVDKLQNMFENIPEFQHRRLINHYPQWFINYYNFLSNLVDHSNEQKHELQQILNIVHQEHFYLQQQIKELYLAKQQPNESKTIQQTQLNQGEIRTNNYKRKKYYNRKNKQDCSYNHQQN